MGSALSGKKAKDQHRVEYSPKTAQERYNARRTGKLIYPPLSSITDEPPKRSLLPDGRLLYESVRMDSTLDQNNGNNSHDKYAAGSAFGNHYRQYDDGTFAVLSRYPSDGNRVFRL